jgi:hypothetical protein
VTPELLHCLESLRFRPHAPEAMKTTVENVEFVAVVHPLKGLALLWTFADGRSVVSGETFVPVTVNIQELAAAMLEVLKICYPRRADL